MIVAPSDEQDRLVGLLAAGPETGAPDGRLGCRICGDRRNSTQAYAMHVYRSHFRHQLDRDHQLQVPGYSACPDCKAVVASITAHRRTAHGVVSGRGRIPAAEIERSTAPDARARAPRAAAAEAPTPTEAGLAILAGLAPGGSVPVERLHDVIEWLRATEELVDLIRVKR